MYAFNSPLNFSDPSGLAPKKEKGRRAKFQSADIQVLLLGYFQYEMRKKMMAPGEAPSTSEYAYESITVRTGGFIEIIYYGDGGGSSGGSNDDGSSGGGFFSDLWNSITSLFGGDDEESTNVHNNVSKAEQLSVTAFDAGVIQSINITADKTSSFKSNFSQKMFLRFLLQKGTNYHLSDSEFMLINEYAKSSNAFTSNYKLEFKNGLSYYTRTIDLTGSPMFNLSIGSYSKMYFDFITLQPIGFIDKYDFNPGNRALGAEILTRTAHLYELIFPNSNFLIIYP